MSYPLDSLVNAPAVSTQELTLEGVNLRLAPNPASGPVQLFWEGFSGVSTQIQVFNTNGQLVWATQFTPQSGVGQELIVLPSATPAGMYWVKVAQGNRSRTLKLLYQP